jgi:hypothetical protein
MGQPVTTDGTEYRVANPRLNKSLFSPGVHGPTLRSSTGQFVAVDVRRNGEPPKLLTDEGIRSSVDGDTSQTGEPIPSVDSQGDKTGRCNADN